MDTRRLPQRRRGQALRAEDINKIAEAAKSALNTTPGTGMETRKTAKGSSLVLNPAPFVEEYCVRGYNPYDTRLELYSVVELYQADEGVARSALNYCRLPSQSGFARLGIVVSRSIGPQGVGWVQNLVGTRSPILYSGTPLVGGRLGGHKGSGSARPDFGGPFRVERVVDDSYCIVTITGDRLDAKMVDCDAVDATCSGPYHTIIFKGMSLTEDSPGKLETT